MLFGRYASNAREARFPQLWLGRQWAACPSVQGPAGLNLYDLAGGRQRGTLTNMDVATDWVRSQGRYALDFDGINDTVEVPDSDSLDITGGITVSAWIYRRTGNGYRVIVAKRIGSAAPTAVNYQLNLHTTAGALEWYNLTEYISTYIVPTDVWTHVAGTVTAGGVLNLWANGVSVYSATGVARVANTATLRIGTRPDGGEAFNGQMDDVAIYNRAITAGEMRLLAMRRGIAYEMRRDIVFGQSGFKAYLARQRAGLIGGGV